ncbi:MAG: phage/plasmid primase, P4 family [Lachnospiraceae bacterium]|nr:phage/plasmid primase, P4 family [Lachnospiraceae bacterium]
MREELSSIAPEKLEALDKTMDLFTPPPDMPDPMEPIWFVNGAINEILFSEDYLRRHPMKCIKKRLYDINGSVDEACMEHEIYKKIANYVSKDVAKLCTRLMDSIKIAAYAEDLPVDTENIHFRNGTYNIAGGSFTEEKVFCRNRLPVDYVPDPPIAEEWYRFLDDLFYPEDIPAVKEFMGYSMLPTNRGQCMMILLGKGGEGKSLIGDVLELILGNNMSKYGIKKLAVNKFGPGDLQGKLLMVDDDMTSDALPDTGIIKSIVTMEGKSDMEKKHASSFQEVMYCRILAFSNVPLSSLYDKSEGFYRRQLIIQVKPKEKCRQDDKNILDRLKKEINGITRWCIDGLERIYDNNFHFTISDRMKKIAEELRQEDNNILSFFDSTGYIRFEKNTFALSRDLYTAYQKWCEDNLEKPYSMTTFSRQLKQSAESLRLNYDKNLTIPGGKKARGYHGICVMLNPGFM